MEPPKAWPRVAAESYEPVRPLGKGGFGSVLLAKRRDSPETSVEKDLFVAMKAVGGNSASKSEAGYAQREVAVLSELSHPHIVRLIRVFDQTDGEVGASRCIALSFARGPTLEQLLNHRGALGLPLTHTVSVQLIDAVSYLHSRAVIHRDIKPDNVIISGCRLGDEAVWTDGDEAIRAEKEERWKVTLIDFGFARPLSPAQISTDIGLFNVVNDVNVDIRQRDPKFAPSLDNPLEDASIQDGQQGGRGRTLNTDVDSSVSKQRVRNLSALGNRSYAAPEILDGVRPFVKEDRKKSQTQHHAGHAESDNDSSGHGSSLGRSKTKMGTGMGDPLAECVVDYGMVVDAFSLGATIRYMLTGVPPHMSVDEYIAMQRSAFATATRFLGKLLRKSSKKKKGNKNGVTDKKGKKAKRFRTNDELPGEAASLVGGLTHWDQRKRTTVRAARTYAWVADAFENLEHLQNKGKVAANEDVDCGSCVSSKDHGGRIQYLKCALGQNDVGGKQNSHQHPPLIAQEP